MLDDGENGINGIKVYLKNSSGIVKTTTTSELGIYSEINGGEYQFVDVDLDEVQKGSYYIEFEYCGITYQSVAANLNENRGSKAIDTETRNALDSKFTSVEGNGTQNLSINGVTANYKDTSNHVSSLDSHIDKNYNYRYDASNTHTGCDVYARTNEAGYNMYANFTPVTEEIRYINLGLHEKAQTDYALTQDLYNVRAEINGFSHIYRYGKVRYSNNGNTIDENSSWNLGVKFQNNKGTYSRAIYNSDVNYINSKNKDRELKVYVTYKIALKNESSYLGRINNIVNYSDIRYDLIAAGTSINDKDEISGNKTYSKKTKYNDEYSKYTIDVNTVLKPGETKYIYVQFEMQREAILAIVNNKNELLNNVAEINSYTTFKDNNTNTPVAVLDKDSVPGNTKPGNVDTYEDDTDAARSLKLELKNARVIEGTVFVDNPEGIDINSVNTGKERKGNGIFDNGEKTISGIKVTLKENEESESGITPVTTETDENGNFKFEGYVPGKYVLTYTWGDKEYKVQYYKGTIYDESRKQDDKYWYRGSEYNNDTISVNARKTDALDSREIRDQIDNEMENLKINTLESEIEKAYNGGSSYITKTQMDSTTPEMYFSVEYETTITDGTDDKIEFKVKNVDFGIIERARQLLEFNKRVSAFKITLANGQVLADATIDENGKLHGSHQYTTYMGPTNSNNIATSGTVKIEMDTEIIEGATVEITYEMKVTNIGEVDYVSDRYYYYGNSKGSDKVRVSVTGLIDYVDNQLSVLDDKWEQKDTTTLEEYNARQKDNEAYINTINTYFTTKLSKNLAPTESNTVTLTTSKLLTSTKDIEFNNQAEIAEITKPNTFNSGSPAKVVWNGDKGSFQYDNAEKFIIVPSTGSNKNYTLPIVIGIISVLTLGLGAFGIKKFVIGK